MSDIKFGTDGWRGKIAEDYTFDNVRRCAQGFATYLEEEGCGGAKVVVGYDRRFASEDFAAVAAEVMAGNGFHVLLTQGATPTPVISYSAVHHKAAGAINITASHNPPSDNGFKVRDEHGGAVDPAGLKRIEAAIPDSADGVKRVPLEKALKEGGIEYLDPVPAYVGHLKDLVDVEKIKEAGLKIVHDPMWGNGIGWFDQITLKGGTNRFVTIHNVRNPIFPGMKRPEPIPPNIDEAMKKVKEVGADIGIVNDGDADRIGFIDEHGRFVDQLRSYALLAYYMLEVRGDRGPIVKTISTTSMLNKLGEIYGVPVYETGVGFKYVAPKMVEVDALIGGEESGGYAFRRNVPERDGILAGLYMLDFMLSTRKTLSQLIEQLFELVGPHYYNRIDVRFPNEKRPEAKARMNAARPDKIAGLKVVGINTLDGYKFEMEDGGWLLVRFSGTEPIIRVYTETTREDLVQAILEEGLRIAGLKEN